MTSVQLGDVLPAAPWTRRGDLKALIAAMGPGNARYVGGAVRDTLLGLEVRDIDLATTIEPRKVIRLLENTGIRVIPTGIDHGTVTAVLADGPVEITTLRHDVSTDGRRATVAFARDWQDDAARRDFTINALYADPDSGALFDYFGGLADLAARRVRFIGEARERICEDHLRILRYFRFQARFGTQPADIEAEQSCAELAGTLKALSRERIGMETMNLLALPDPAPTLARMAELGVLQEILPEADPAALPLLVGEERRQDVAPDPLRRLAALLPADADLASHVAARFRLSGAQKKRLIMAARRGDAPIEARALAYRLGREQALDRLLLTGRDAAALTSWDIPTFPLRGRDVVARGVKAGPQVARILSETEERWVAEGFPDAARTGQLLDEQLGSA
jgi:poly(A) polymerase